MYASTHGRSGDSSGIGRREFHIPPSRTKPSPLVRGARDTRVARRLIEETAHSMCATPLFNRSQQRDHLFVKWFQDFTPSERGGRDIGVGPDLVQSSFV